MIYSVQVKNDSGVTTVQQSPKPTGTTTFFTSEGDAGGAVGGGQKLIFSLSVTDSFIDREVSFSEDVYLIGGWLETNSAPYGATMRVAVLNQTGVEISCFCDEVFISGTNIYQFTADDPALIPAGYKLRITVNNSNGSNGLDPATSFIALGVLKIFRTTTI